jgi:hypothetical protein
VSEAKRSVRREGGIYVEIDVVKVKKRSSAGGVSIEAHASLQYGTYQTMPRPRIIVVEESAFVHRFFFFLL